KCIKIDEANNKTKKTKAKKGADETEKIHANAEMTLNKWSWQKFQSNKQRVSDRNKKSKSSKANKPVTNGSKKPSEKESKASDMIDFSTYDRVESDTEDEHDGEHENDEFNALHEINRKPFSWNDTKVYTFFLFQSPSLIFFF
ncbi:hypothetical protein RFI_06786, partial [Reticulomyxa filosa]